jgi:lipoate-protein ligase A
MLIVHWSVERFRGSAAAFHERPIPTDPVPSLWWFEIEQPAIVLGSAQVDEVVDRDACERLGVEIVRRRSGGGAVLLVPGEVAWFDLVIPRSHPLWDGDIGRAAWWVGDVVVDALGESDGEVHRGGLLTSAWSSTVCFAGLGPGEVRRHGRKLLGLSQRRTRDAARFQCAVYRVWDAGLMHSVLRPPRPSPDELGGFVATADLGLVDLERALSRVSVPPAT